ncbi:unnamed protein product [Cuscuta campestris]|uniref:Uncharacterized protein n=1 Tax=Cuscuta campestris TaxID=132261 RepID=A0A484KE29_9ASTE|nr:unnamed protein product [Cuscuta campestris]
MNDQEFALFMGDMWGRNDVNLQTLEDIFEDVEEADEPTPESNDPTREDDEIGEPEISKGSGKAYHARFFARVFRKLLQGNPFPIEIYASFDCAL